MVVLQVFERYLECYHQAKEKAELNPGERPFEFSEMYIFGKFRAFSVRLKKIMEAATFGRTYSVIGGKGKRKERKGK